MGWKSKRAIAPERSWPYARVLATLLIAALVGPLGGCWIRNFDRDKQPDLVLITVDTLRADHLQLYGHKRTNSPVLAQLGREGVTFYQAIAPAPWTLPSMASIHTGAPPHRHGAIDNGSPIDPALPTVAEVLQRHGYRTVAVTSHAFVGQAFGFARGFDVFDESIRADHTGSTSQALTEAALAHLEEDGDSPTFLWVHYFDPHYNYERHPEYALAEGPQGRFGDSVDFASPDGRELLDATRSELDYMRDVYDEEIAHTDHWIGQLVEGVRGAHRDRAAIFAVTADHGEAFLEHGRLAHGRELYDELIRVPLIISGDIDRTIRGIGTGRAVETSAMATTLLGLAGIEEHEIEGIDLIETALNRQSPPFAFSEGSHARGSDGRKVAIVQGDWKLIHDLDRNRFEFYNRRVDPHEHKDLARDPKSRKKLGLLKDPLLARSKAVRALSARRGGPAPAARLDADERARLSALGYLDAPAPAPGAGASDAPRCRRERGPFVFSSSQPVLIATVTGASKWCGS